MKLKKTLKLRSLILVKRKRNPRRREFLSLMMPPTKPILMRKRKRKKRRKTSLRLPHVSISTRLKAIRLLLMRNFWQELPRLSKPYTELMLAPLGSSDWSSPSALEEGPRVHGSTLMPRFKQSTESISTYWITSCPSLVARVTLDLTTKWFWLEGIKQSISWGLLENTSKTT